MENDDHVMESVTRTSQAIDPTKLCLYDLPEDGPSAENMQGRSLALRYPDWNEESTFCISGPIGAGTCKGVHFAEFIDAVRYWTKVHGKHIETHWWPLPAGKGSGGKYGIRFRKKAA